MYSIAIHLIAGLVRIAALFNPKLKLFVSGRTNIFLKLKTAFKSEQSPIVWVHCASLGEFEQARTLIEKFKTEFPTYKILLTFFSPSGFEVRKNYDKADYIFYLPWDTRENADRFIQVVNPKLAIFIKYEFWRNYIHALDKYNIPLLSVSSIFREGQIFFKSYGSLFRSTLKKFDHFFVQNEMSKALLQTIGINKITIAGDTRFDRVHQIVSQSHDIPIAEQFKGSDNVFMSWVVVGQKTWRYWLLLLIIASAN